MPRTKKANRKGNGAFRGGHNISGNSHGLESKKGGRSNLTLQEEALNTARHHNFWETDQRLRNTRVNFVSAGQLDPTIPQEETDPTAPSPESALAEMTLNSPVGEVIVEVYEEELSAKDQASSSTGDSSEPPSFFIDTQGGSPVRTGYTDPRPRSSSPTPSNSSEEVILFAGRDAKGRGIPRAPEKSILQKDSIDAKIGVIEDRIHEQKGLLNDVLHRRPHNHSTAAEENSKTPDKYLSDDIEYIHRKKKGKRGTASNWKQREEDALIADYIANIDREENFTVEDAFNYRELGGTGDVNLQGESLLSSEELPSDTHQPGWDRDDIVDFDDFSTSDGVMGEVKEIVSKRMRASGLQYLVVWDDQAIDEARWVPMTTLTSINALLQIEKFETEEQLVAEFLGNVEDESDDSDDMEADSNDSMIDGQERNLQRKVEQMSDEQIARLLAKQEELGMGSGELLLFDDEGDDADEDVAFPLTKFSLSKSKGKGKSQRSTRRLSDCFPSATAVADAYDGFDVMDFDRPSLLKQPKGRKGKLIIDISDSDFEETMQNAWDNDRVKKKARKQEREELRAQGLLGRKNGKPNLKQKYKEGMGIDEVRDEIKRFLQSNDTTLALPPMEKGDRKVVHELANAFKLKSKSDGSGKKRFPVLYKTQNTRPYFEKTFDAIEARVSRKFLPRMDIGGRRTNTTNRSIGRGGGFNKAAVSYNDGDIVGGSAPELGVENRGRAMLEKMGWSTGTGLGALNNKGILQPVSHIVKTTKAGLG